MNLFMAILSVMISIYFSPYSEHLASYVSSSYGCTWWMSSLSFRSKKSIHNQHFHVVNKQPVSKWGQNRKHREEYSNIHTTMLYPNFVSVSNFSFLFYYYFLEIKQKIYSNPMVVPIRLIFFLLSKPKLYSTPVTITIELICFFSFY